MGKRVWDRLSVWSQEHAVIGNGGLWQDGFSHLSTCVYGLKHPAEKPYHGACDVASGC